MKRLYHSTTITFQLSCLAWIIPRQIAQWSRWMLIVLNCWSSWLFTDRLSLFRLLKRYNLQQADSVAQRTIFMVDKSLGFK